MNLNSLNNDFYFFIPELFFLFFFLFIFVFCILYSNINIYKYTKLTKTLTFLFILIFFYYIILSYNNIDHNFIISYYLFVCNDLIFFLKCFLIFLSWLIILILNTFLTTFGIISFEFIFLFIMSCFSMLLLIMAYDFIIVYLCIELQSLCFYIMIAINREKNKAIEASLKYFILGSFSSTILLLGIGFIYGATGVTNFKDLSLLLNFNINLFLPSDYLFFLGFFLISIGFFFKLSIAPFHIWLPDIFMGAARPVIIILGILPKFSIFILFYKFCFLTLLQHVFILQNFFTIFIFLSWIMGLLGAIQTNKLNKFLAYSSINHLGFILLSLTINDLFSFIFYLFNYLIISLNIFIILCCLKKFNNNLELIKIEQLLYIKKNNFIIFFNFFICLFSLAGVPPLAGFFGKFFILMNSFNANFFFITLFGLLISLICCFYYLRIIKFLTFNNSKNYIFLINLDKKISYMLSFGILFNCIFILFLPFFFNLIKYFTLLSFLN